MLAFGTSGGSHRDGDRIPVLGARTGSARLDAEPFEPAQYSGLADTEDAADLRDGLVLLLVQAGKELVDRLAVDVLGMRLDPKFSDVITNLDFTIIPVYGSVTAGEPAFVMDKPMDYITFPKQLLKGATFAVRVTGDSMNGIDIRDGDILLVRRQDTADPGDIVVARINGDEYTIKRLKVEGGKAILKPENPAYSPIVSEDLHIVGKVVSILRNL